MTFLAHIADRALNRPLLILPEKCAVIAGVISGRIGIAAPEASRFEGEWAIETDDNGRRKPLMFRQSGQVGIISVVGSLVNRGAWIGANSGLTSYEGIQKQLRDARTAQGVEAVILDLSTPGGEAIGAFETAAAVRELAAVKPVIAVVNGMAASAGYAIASGATEIVTTETGLSGSIGVVMMHVDYSRFLANEGINPTFVFAGKHKVDGHPFAPLSDDVRSDIQAEIDAFYDQFLATVALGRGHRLTAQAARSTEARTFVGEAAVKAGLADRVATFEMVLADLNRAHSSGPGPGQPQGGRPTSSTKGKTMSEPNTAPAAEVPAGSSTPAAAPAAPPNTQAAVDAAVTADRARMAALDELAAECNGSAEGLKMIAAAKADGSSAEVTGLKLIKAGVFRKAAVVGALQLDEQTAAAATPSAPGGRAEAPQTPDGWKAEYAASAALQGEFTSAEAYVAFKKAEARGGVRVLGAKPQK